MFGSKPKLPEKLADDKTIEMADKVNELIKHLNSSEAIHFLASCLIAKQVMCYDKKQDKVLIKSFEQQLNKIRCQIKDRSNG